MTQPPFPGIRTSLFVMLTTAGILALTGCQPASPPAHATLDTAPDAAPAGNPLAADIAGYDNSGADNVPDLAGPTPTPTPAPPAAATPSVPQPMESDGLPTAPFNGFDFTDPTTPNTTRDLGASGGGGEVVGIVVAPGGPVVDHFEGIICKDSVQAGIFSVPAHNGRAVVTIKNAVPSSDYHIKVKAFDAAHHMLNKHAPDFENFGPYVLTGNQTGTLSVTITL